MIRHYLDIGYDLLSNNALLASILTALFTYIFSQVSIKKNKIKEIKNNIVYTCDKIIQYAINAEMNQLSFRWHEHLYYESKSEQHEYEYRQFHDKALDSIFNFHLQKSEMTKHLHELYIYDKKSARKISSLFNKSNSYEIRPFILDKEEGVELKYSKLFEGVRAHILYDSMGIHLSEIMGLLGLNIEKSKLDV